MKRKKLGCLAAAFGLSVLFSPIVNAVNFPSETYVIDSNGKDRIYIPNAYVTKQVIHNFGGSKPFLSGPSDLFISTDGTLYLSDTGNNRVLKLNTSFQITAEFTEADNLPFSSPNGIYVDELGDILIADSGNKRIVHLDKNGMYIEKFIKPESDLLVDVYEFEPNKVAFNPNTGFLYLIQGRQFMSIDALNQFKGYVGAQEVGFDLKDFLIRLFGSDTQKKAIGKRYPAAYANFTICSDQLIYAVGLGKTDQIKVINSVGNNIFPKGFYGEMSYEEDGTAVFPVLGDIAVNQDGTITVVEQNSCKLYQYDSEGNLLSVFGGKGSEKGYFQLPSSIVAGKNGELYILDSAEGNLHVLEPTRFTTLVHNATKYYLSGQYEESLSIWEKVTQIDRNYPLAQKNIGKILFKQKDYTASMEAYKLADDPQGYGEAFEKYRYELFRTNFGWVAITGSVIFIGLIALLVWLFHKSDQFDDDLNGVLRSHHKKRGEQHE